MDQSNKLNLSYVMPAQAQKHVTVNETFRNLDALVHMSAVDDTTTTQPASPSENDGYILPAGKSGAQWDNMTDLSFVMFQDGAWMEYPAVIGMRVFDQSTNELKVFNGTAWTAISSSSGGAFNDLTDVTLTSAQGHQLVAFDGASNEWVNTDQVQSLSLFGLGTNADASNPFAAKVNKAFWTALEVASGGDGDLRYTLNKETSTDVLSMLFQSGYSARAEFGLVGDDDLVFRNSVDGSNFIDTLRLKGDGTIQTNYGQLSETTDTPAAYLAVDSDGAVKEIAPENVGLVAAEAYANLLRADLVANGGVNGGNPARNTQVAMGEITIGTLQIASADHGNEVVIYDSGQDFSDNIVRERFFLSKGEVAIRGSVPRGAIIRSAKGVCSMFGDTTSYNYLCLTEGFAGKQFFFYYFRSAPAGSRIYVAAGALAAKVQALTGDGATVIDSADLQPYESATMVINANDEFQVVSDQPIYAATGAYGTNDFRLLVPLSTEIIGHSRRAEVSALYDNTVVEWTNRAGQSGSFTVSPGAPFALSTVAGNLTDFDVNGFVILRSSGPISCFCGADGGGGDAESFYPTTSLSQRIPVPQAMKNNGRGGLNGLFIASPYKGTARIYDHQNNLVATVPLDRVGSDQSAPCAGSFGADTFGTGQTVAMTSDYYGGYVEADVPIYVVQNSDENETLLSGGFDTTGKESALYGVTPEDMRAEITRDTDGNLRKRVIDGATGVESWALA